MGGSDVLSRDGRLLRNANAAGRSTEIVYSASDRRLGEVTTYAVEQAPDGKTFALLTTQANYKRPVHDSRRYEWTSSGRMIRVFAGVTAAQFNYDILGRLVGVDFRDEGESRDLRFIYEAGSLERVFLNSAPNPLLTLME